MVIWNLFHQTFARELKDGLTSTMLPLTKERKRDNVTEVKDLIHELL